MAQPSYQRSTSGLVGALVVTLLVIGAFVAFRALTRDELETRPVWAVSLLTDQQRYLGIRQEDDQLDDLLATYVDENVESRPDVRVAGSVAKDWQVFADDGGDLAYAAQLGDQVVMVYGSAGEEDLRLVLERLTTEPVGSTG